MPTLAIVGPGAIGCTLAAWLSQDPRCQVTIAARTAFSRIELKTPSGETIIATPRVILKPEEGKPVDWILVTTKTYDAANAAAWFNSLCGPTTRVAVLQNGVEHVERFTPFLSPEVILPIVIDCPAERFGPGKVTQRRAGWMAIPESPAGRTFAALFSHTPLETRLITDFKTEAWKKLCVNSAGALSAILLQPAAISHRASIAECMRGIVRECVAVGRAEGATLEDDLPDTIVAGYRMAPPDSVNSMHGDRLAGRPMEIDARNGVIVRLGKKHRIPTPYNALVVALLEAYQEKSG